MRGIRPILNSLCYAVLLMICSTVINKAQACTDVHSSCEFFKSKGYCTSPTLKDSMKDMCKFTCGFCSLVTEWSQWSQWSDCLGACGSNNTHDRTRVCQHGNLCRGSPSQKRFCVSLTCTEDGEWSSWGPWSKCKGSCGTIGSKSRTRVCENGDYCSGSDASTTKCSVAACQVGQWSPWSAWGACNAACGTRGKKERTRTCRNGNNCSGPNRKIRNCNGPTCTQVWSSWNAWSSCDKTCGPGQRRRTRLCRDSSGCTGSSSETRSCNVDNCVAWNEWGNWESCSLTCGGGIRLRVRTCNKQSGCVGSADEDEDCNVIQCPNWSSWRSWGSCDKTCGDGERTRRRTCKGGSCPGSNTDTKNCNVQECIGYWSNWSRWSVCSATCGRGSQTSSRTCLGSGTCKGNSTDVKDCLHPTVCPCSCQASSTCFNNPNYAEYCGSPDAYKYCHHDTFGDWHKEHCKSTCGSCQCECGTWSDWTGWSRCDVTCGDGQQTRRRTCPSQKTCDGPSVDVQTCTNSYGCRGNWMSWGQWGSCTGQCRNGRQTRSRICSTPNACRGSTTNQRWCSAPCTSWGQWGPCSRTCGLGTRTRKSCLFCSVEYDDCYNRDCPQEFCRYPNQRRYSVNSHSCCNGQFSDSCGISGRTGRIFNGTLAEDQIWPWMVHMIHPVGNGYQNLCGGMLITYSWVLTAAHCFNDVSANRITVYLGSVELSDRHKQVRSVARSVLHPNYSAHKNDIALLQLDRPANPGTYVRPICLPKGEDTLVDNMCVALGWGQVNPSSPVSAQLREANLRILDYKICDRAYNELSSSDKNLHICAGSIRGQVDTCKGDSGGPLMCQRCSNCGWFAAGITSFGGACGTPNSPGVYTRVSTYEHWIRTYTGAGGSVQFSACQ